MDIDDLKDELNEIAIIVENDDGEFLAIDLEQAIEIIDKLNKGTV